MSVTVVEHPLVQHKLGILRSQDTSTAEFRAVANEVAILLLYEAARNFPTEERVARGWSGMVPVRAVAGDMITVVPILRAGLGLMGGVLEMLPQASVSLVGLYRNETTLEPVEYYVKLAGGMDRSTAIILDPMLATGGSAVACIDILKRAGCPCLCSLHLVCAPEGVARVTAAHPDVDIFTASIDDGLNGDGYILPGLGDAGDRLFGTR